MITTTNNSELISLREIVPLSGNYVQKKAVKALQKVIQTHIGVIGLAIAAIKSFQQGDLPDPLVGENACQIRAAYYCAQAGDPKTMSALAGIYPKLEGLIARISNVELPKGKELASWDEILRANDLDCEVPSTVVPIVYGHVLTITKESDLSIKKKEVSLKEGNDPKKLVGLSTSAARELIKHARRSLSEWSVQYLQNEAARVGMNGPEGILTDSMGLKTAPALPGVHILFASMKVHQTWIALKTRIIDEEGGEKGQVTLFYAPSGQDRSYQVVKVLVKEDFDRTCFLVEAVSLSSKQRTEYELAAELIKEDIEPMILATIASHPQYGGGHKTKEPPPTEERERLKAIAKQKGLCAENPDLCRMYHIYAARIGGVL